MDFAYIITKKSDITPEFEREITYILLFWRRAAQSLLEIPYY